MHAMMLEKAKVFDPHNLKHKIRRDDDSDVFSHVTKESKTKLFSKMKTMKLSRHDDLFYSWECVSLVLEHSTVDFVIKDMYNMLYLLHVLQHYKMQPPPPGQKGCLKPFKILKLKMKLAYECWL